MKQIDVRISDNILGEREWSVYRLTIEGGKVVRMDTIYDGVYRRDLVGMTVEQLAEWIAYDPTGSHPEVYHEWRPIGGDKWIEGNFERAEVK